MMLPVPVPWAAVLYFIPSIALGAGILYRINLYREASPEVKAMATTGTRVLILIFGIMTIIVATLIVL